MSTAREIIAKRLDFWRAKLARAEGKYHSDSININERDRVGALHECHRCSAVVIELEGLAQMIGEEEK